MAHYLVTGAVGFIGSHLCERLLAEGHRVRAVDRFSQYYDRARKEANISACTAQDGFRLIEADLVDVDFDALLDGVDGVFHLAAQPGVRPSWGEGFVDYVRDNVLATQRLFDALRRHPAPAAVASSSSVYGDCTELPVSEDGTPLRPVSPYGLTKLAVEHLARIYIEQYGIHAVLLRYFTVYGPRQRPDMAFTRFVSAALEDTPLNVLGDGTQSRDFSYVEDIVDATVRAIAAPAGRIYNVGGGQPTSLNEVIATLEQLLERPLKVERESMAAGDVRHTWADTTRARNELGWEPRTTLARGLEAQLAWLQATGTARTTPRSAARCTVPVVMARRPADPGGSGARPRILTYSHDGFGLGHLRRNLRLVEALTAQVPSAAVLMVTGSPASNHFRFPDNVDYVKLPSLTKIGNGDYVSRQLGLDGQGALGLRSKLALAAAEEFEPDVVLVDHYPLGVSRELEPALERLRDAVPHTRLVLGMRDILDDAAEVRRNWIDGGHIDGIERYFDQVLVYGCQEICDPFTEYGFPASISDRTTFTGYLVDEAARRGRLSGDVGTHVACVLGGGEDGRATAWAFLEAMTHLVTHGWSGTLVTGPLMPTETSQRLMQDAARIGVRCLVFVDDMPALLAMSDVVVAMGGYNTVCELLAAGTPSVIIPRTTPRREQLIRAERLADRGLVNVLHPLEASGHRLAALIEQQAQLSRGELRSRVAASLGTGGLKTAASALADMACDRVGVAV